MKNILLILIFGGSLVSCKEKISTPTEQPPNYTLEGKWVLEDFPNTMYLFDDGIRYKYYCITGDCDSFWNACEPGDTNSLPGTNNYTFENDTLNVDLNFGNSVSSFMEFVCEGEVVKSQSSIDTTYYARWHRVGVDISGCKE